MVNSTAMAESPSHEIQRGYRIAGLAVTMVGALLSGCATPREIDGHKVTGTRWMDGKVVYAVEESEADRAKMKQDAKAAEDAANGVVFKPER